MSVQRLFDNGYTRPGRLPGAVRHRADVGSVRKKRGRALARWSVAAGIGIAAALLAMPSAALAAPVLPAGVVGPAVARYDTGRVTAVFPSTLPRVELFQDANASVGATLQLDQILELAPGGYPHPTAVAAAFPASVTGVNGTAGANGSGPVELGAALDVLPVGAPLWDPSAVLTPVGPTIGGASLRLTYTFDANGTSSDGVRLAWNVSGWPWVAPGDLLAVEFGFSLVTGRSLATCTGVTPLDLAPGCAVTAPGPAGAVWSSGFTSFEGGNGSGPIADLAWEAATLPGGRSVGYTVGAFSPANGSAEIALGAAAGGATAVAGSARFALVAPALPSVPGLLRGNAVAYAATVAVLATAALAAAVAYRRRDRRLREEL